MTEIKLSLIDISQFPQEFEGHDFQYHPEVAKLREACKEWGFFRVVNHGVPADLLQKVLSVCRDLLSMPVEVKDRVTTSNPLESYARTPGSPIEIFVIPDMPNPDFIRKLSRKMWPKEGNPDFCEAIGTYSSLLSDMAAKITKIILASLGVDASKFYKSDFEKCKAKLHIVGYSSDGKSAGEVALPSHADPGCVTILHSDAIEGLQVRSKQGTWCNVYYEPDSFIVNVGDCIKVWSNNRYCSSDHRVVFKDWKNRVSLPYFINFPPDTQVVAPEELCDENNPRRYKPFPFSDLVNEMIKRGEDVEEMKKRGEEGDIAKSIERFAGA